MKSTRGARIVAAKHRAAAMSGGKGLVRNRYVGKIILSR
jgi:hypothetical protein